MIWDAINDMSKINNNFSFQTYFKMCDNKTLRQTLIFIFSYSLNFESDLHCNLLRIWQVGNNNFNIPSYYFNIRLGRAIPDSSV